MGSGGYPGPFSLFRYFTKQKRVTLKPGPIGAFRATCRKYHADGKTRCDEEFHDGPALAAHMKANHPHFHRANRLVEPTMIRPRRKPFGAPAVALDKQAIPPGTRFTHKDRACQVVGAVSATRTRYLVWFPDDVEPDRKGACRHWETGPDEDGMWLWELTAETKKVADAVADSAKGN